MRATKVFVVLAAAALPGCGAPHGAGDGSDESALAAVDPTNQEQLSSWLAANEIERQPVIAEAGTRGAARALRAIHLLYPRGETRADALHTYAIEVAATDVQGEGRVEFRRGREVLYREPAPFSGSARFVHGTIPVQVRESVKPGESLTWGVFFADRAEANSVAVVRVVKKPAAEKQVARLEGDRRNARQSALVRSLGRSQVLFNNGLYGEALASYLGLAFDQSSVGETWARIVECLRRLDLNDAPLYADALALMTGTKGSATLASAGPGTPTVVGLRPGGALPLRGDPSVGVPASRPAARVPESTPPPAPGQEPAPTPESAPEPVPPAPPVDAEPAQPTPAPGQPTPGQPAPAMPGRAVQEALARAERAARDLERANEAVAQATQAVAAASSPEAQGEAGELLEQAQRAQDEAQAAAGAAREALDQANRAALEALLLGTGQPTPTVVGADGTVSRLEAWVSQLEARSSAAFAAADAADAAARRAEEEGDPEAAALRAQADALRDAAQAAGGDALAARRSLEQLLARLPSSIR